MKKGKLQTLALMGMMMGMSPLSAEGAETLSQEQQEFYEMLDAEGQSQFLQLDPAHRKAALKVTEQYCKAVHECRGTREASVREQYIRQHQQK